MVKDAELHKEFQAPELVKPFGPKKLIKLALVNDLLKRKDLTMKSKLIVIGIIDEVIPDD